MVTGKLDHKVRQASRFVQVPSGALWLFAIGIELANDVPVQCSQDANARHHRRAAKRRDQDRGLHCGLPFRRRVFAARRAGLRAATVWDRQNGPTKALTVTHHWDGLFVPIEIGPHVSPSLAAHLADEPRFQFGQPDVIGPSVPADRD
jgi:hypothetical protein